MGAFDAFAIAASHGAFGGFVWLLADAHYKARERGKQASRAEMRSWLDGLEDGRYDLDHPGWGSLAEATGFKAPADASALTDAVVIDLRDPKGGAS